MFKSLQKKLGRQKLFFLYTVLLVSIGLMLSLGFHARWLVLEQIVSFTPTVVTVLLVATIAAVGVIIFKRHTVWRRSVIAVGVTIVLGVYSVAYSLTVQPQVRFTSSEKQGITYAAFNKLYSNHDIEKAATYFKKQHIDIVSLEEAYPHEVVDMRNQLGFKYSYMSNTLNTVRGTAVGIVSRYPIEKSETLAMSAHTSVVRVEVSTPNEENLAVYGAHISGPFTQTMYEHRNADFVRLASILQKEKIPTLLGGDFNTTIFSPALKEFNDVIGDKYNTTTTQAWPPCSWYRASLFCLRIDHVYTSKDIRLQNTYIAPNLGSDHRAVIITFSI